VQAVKVLVLGLLWVLMAPDNRGSFPTAASCEAAITAWINQARDGARWVAAQQQATMQSDPALTLFWRRSARMAEEQAARARGAWRRSDEGRRDTAAG